MKYLISIIILSLLFSCQKEYNPNGHWHIKNGSINEISLDINDSVTIVNQYDIQHSYKKERRYFKTNQINLWECGSGSFTYSVKGNNIYLHDFFDVTGQTLEGYRCGKNCCDKKKEILQNLKVKMDLPEIKNKRTELNPQKITSSLSLIIGKLKSNYEDFYGDNIQLQLNDKFATINKIGFFIEEKKVKLPDSLHHKTQYQLVIDNSIMLSEAKPVVDELLRLKIDSSRIWIACFNENLDSSNYLEHVSIKNFNFNSVEKISDSIK